MVRKSKSEFARIACAAVSVLMVSSAIAAETSPLEEVVVTNSRIPANLSSIPASVTLISPEEIAEQSTFSNDIGDMLGRLVPGLAANSGGSYQNFHQTLRGRRPLIFIDGVPATVGTRDGGHDNRLISAGAIGRVEVIRGATALYGLGSGGGLINYSTKSPVDGPAQYSTELSVGSSLTHASSSSAVSSIEQNASARAGRFSYVTSGFYETRGSLYDADGDMIPPDPQDQGGIADTDTYNVFAKVGFDLTENQSIFVSGNLYKTKQDTDYASGVGVYGSIKTPAIRGTPDPRAEDIFTRNAMGTVRYAHNDVFGSSVSVQGYYSDFESLYSYSPDSFPPQQGITTTGGQTRIVSERYGARLDITTPFTISLGHGNILWGVDYAYEEPVQDLLDGRWWVPPLKSESVAPFVQFETPVLSWLTARGGLRYDESDFEVPTFTTLTVQASQPRGVRIIGGTKSFSQLVGNLGFVTTPISSGALEGYSFFVNWSQGYVIGDFGRVLRASNAPSVDAFDFKADVVDNYEVGMRADYGDTKAELAIYYITSQYGSTWNPITFETLRAPEKIRGGELKIDTRFSDTWRGGVSYSTVDGDTQNTATGVWTSLTTARLAPNKFTAYVEHDFNPEWAIRAQYLNSARQHIFDTNTMVYGRHDIEGYSLLDLALAGRVGPGQLTFAITNLLNERYYTPDAWRYVGNSTFTLAEGMAGKITYRIQY